MIQGDFLVRDELLSILSCSIVSSISNVYLLRCEGGRTIECGAFTDCLYVLVSSLRGFWTCRQRPLVQTSGLVLDLAGSRLLCIYLDYDW